MLTFTLRPLHCLRANESLAQKSFSNHRWANTGIGGICSSLRPCGFASSMAWKSPQLPLLSTPIALMVGFFMWCISAMVEIRKPFVSQAWRGMLKKDSAVFDYISTYQENLWFGGKEDTSSRNKQKHHVKIFDQFYGPHSLATGSL